MSEQEERLRAALREIAERAQAVIDGKRLVGGGKAVAFDLLSVAKKAIDSASNGEFCR